MMHTTLDYRDLYELPDELLEFRSAIRKLAEDRIRPRASEIDRTGTYPWDVRRLLAEHDVLGLPVRPNTAAPAREP